MKRDMELIRRILFKVESEISVQPKIYGFRYGNEKMVIDGYTDEQVYEHLLMLIESPFVGGKLMASGLIAVKCLTWDGREFLDSIRGDDIWKKTKSRAEQLGEVGVSLVWEIAKAELKAKLGLPA